MVSGLGLPVSIGRFVSQCAEAMSSARGRGSARAMSCQAARTAPGSMACMGEPCDRNSVGSGLPLLT
jgi:hypothetical protein